MQLQEEWGDNSFSSNHNMAFLNSDAYMLRNGANFAFVVNKTQEHIMQVTSVLIHISGIFAVI